MQPPIKGYPSTTFRLSPEARRLLREVGAFHGLRSTPALEFLIREAARIRGISLPAGDTPNSAAQPVEAAG